MTLSAGAVSLTVKPDTTRFGKDLHDGIMGGVSGIGKAMGTSLMVGAAAVIAAGATVLTVGLKAAMADDAITAQYAAGIKSTGNAANLSVQGMDNLAKSIALYSGQSDESIGKTEQLLQTFVNIKNVGPNKIFDQATVAAADMAAKMGGDASGMAIKLGKALNDPVKGMTALARVGVQFTQSQKDQITAMVKSGDVMGAQKVILAELQTEFGGAAKAAGETLPGEVSRAREAFDQMSKGIVEGILPVVTPMFAGIASGITKAMPGLKAFGEVFAKNVAEGIRKAQPFIDGVKVVIGKVADDITGTVIPAIQGFVKEFANSEGAGGTLRSILEGLASFITGTVVPAFVNIGKAVVDVVKFFKDHEGAAKALGVTVGAVMLAIGAAWTAKSVVWAIGAAKDVVSWFATATAAQTSASIHKNSIAQIIVGWIAHAATATASGIRTAAVWVAQTVASAAGAVAQVASHVAIAVGGWGVSAAAAVASGVSTAAVWIASRARSIAGAAIAVGALVAVAAGWVASAVVATASGIAMAAAWVVGLGPVAWIIAAVVAIGAALVLAYKKVDWFRSAVDAVWQWMKNAASSVRDWMVGAWNAVVNFFVGLPAKFAAVGRTILSGLKTVFGWTPLGLIVNNWDTIVGFFSGLPGRIGSAVSGMWDGIKNSFKGVINWIFKAWNGIHLTLPSIDTHIPGIGKVGGFTLQVPQIPLLAQGGIVPATPGGRLVRVAEAGVDEAVVPLNGRQSLSNSLGAFDYDRFAAAVSRVSVRSYLDGKNVTASVDQRIGMAMR